MTREEDVKKNISDVKKYIEELTKAIEHLDKKKDDICQYDFVSQETRIGRNLILFE